MKNEVIDNLNKLLANTYSMCLKTQCYHWHCKGSNFFGIHKLLEEHYEELFSAIDEIAEHHLLLGLKAPSNLKDYVQMSDLSVNGNEYTIKESLLDLKLGHETLIANCMNLKELCDDSDVDSEVTIDLAISRIKEHKKMLWMTESSL